MLSGLRIRRNDGFTLVEICIGAALLLVIAVPLITTLRLSADRISVYMDYRKAFNRTLRAAALLKVPVFYCGFGMPVSPAEYNKAFGGIKSDPFRWNGPIEAKSGPSNYPNSELRIAYAQPGSSKLAEHSVSSSFTGCVKLTEAPDSSEMPESFSAGSKDLRRWLLFCGITPPSMPLYITGASGKNLILANNFSSDFSIPKGDRPFVFRAMSVYCRNDYIYTKDFRAAGDQPRVKGVVDMRFDVDMENKLITMYVLSRGDIVHDACRQIIGRESWPEEYIRPWDEKGSRYQMYASKFVWRLPNCICENIMDGKNIVEQHLQRQ